MNKIFTRSRLVLLLLAGPGVLCVLPETLAAQRTDAAAHIDLSPLQWRNVGPFRGGRATAVAGIPADPHTYYMGTAGGGIFMTTDAGTSWENISDGFVKTGSVGALAVAPSNPDIIYAGMGENTARANTVHHGDGIYKSTDGGRTWQHMGLAATQVIGRIRVHPRNPDVVYAGAQGALYGSTEERGVYRSRDGGATWQRVLFIGQTAGVADLAMDATNPDVLYAAIWDHQRFPWELRGYGPLGGVHKSTDGGETWQKLSNGLPAPTGKVGVATTSDPDRVYALVATEGNDAAGIYRSDDAGLTWTLMSDNGGLTDRHWYYTKVVTHPNDPDILWVLNSTMYKSEDGGRTFRNANTPHADRHDLWINPVDPDHMVVADDGGAAVSTDGGVSWSSQENQATSQIYRVVTDNRYPYWLYGAQQDNSTIAIPSTSTARGGMEREWHTVAGYENSFIAVDPDNPDLVYGTNILGEIEEQSQSTRISRTSHPIAMLHWGNRTTKYIKYRYALNTPIFISPHQPKTLYVGANMLLASDDRGDTWREVSPDVTRRGSDPVLDQQVTGTAAVGDGAYGTIVYAAESPVRKGVLWTASDDGRVGVTRDGGANWHVTALPDIPDARINTIDPSPHDPATAYAAATRFQFNDYTPYFFRTSDYGATWTRIGASLPHGGWARVIREDPVRRGLLYAGTELGVFVSLNDGADWQPLQNGLPVTPIYDLVVHPQGDLVVATGGRAFWILDDVSPMRQANATIAGSAVLYRPRPAYRSHLAGGGEPQGGATSGQNAPTGALLNFHLPRATSATIEIVDAAGTVIRQVSPAGGPNRRSADELRAGMNRVSWDLRQTGIPTLNLGGGPGAGRVEGKLVRPGTYTVRLTADATVLTAPLEVRSMPDVRVTDADYAAQEQLLGRIEGVLLEYRRLAQQVESVTDQIAERTNGRTDQALLEAARAYSARLEMPALIYRSLAYIHSRVNAIVPAVRQSQLELFGTLQQDWEAERTVIQQALGAELTAFNAVLARFGLPTIEPAVEPAGSNGT